MIATKPRTDNNIEFDVSNAYTYTSARKRIEMLILHSKTDSICLLELENDCVCVCECVCQIVIHFLRSSKHGNAFKYDITARR